MSRPISPVNFKQEDGDGYGSSFDEDDDGVEEEGKKKRKDLTQKPQAKTSKSKNSIHR